MLIIGCIQGGFASISVNGSEEPRFKFVAYRDALYSEMATFLASLIFLVTYCVVLQQSMKSAAVSDVVSLLA